MRSTRTSHIVRTAGQSGATDPSRSRARPLVRSLTVGALTAALIGGSALTATLPASAASGSGGASVPGSGGTSGNFRPYGYMFDEYLPDGTARQGQDVRSIDWFFANNTHGPAPDTTHTPNAYLAMQTACNTALDRADARKGGAPGTSRVVGMFWASSANPPVIWGSGAVNPGTFETMYDNWVAAGRQGVMDATTLGANVQPYYGMIDFAMAEAVAEARANGGDARAMCLALNESEPPRQYKLEITTDAADAFPIAGGTGAVRDVIHASNGGSSILENVNASSILNWTGVDGSTKAVTKAVSIANNGDTLSPDFTPADFGWETWEGGHFWFDLHVAQQGGMDAPVDTPDRDPRESWTAWKPEPEKDVIGSGEESGELTYDSINGLSVWPGQKLEYTIGVDLRVPAEVRDKITSFKVQDSYDPQFTPDKTSVEFWDSRDATSPKPVPRSAYALTWDAAANSFTATFTDAWVKDNLIGNTAQGWLSLRVTGTVKDTTAPGATVKNQAFQIVNDIKTATEVPVVRIPSFTPDKEDLNTDLIDIDKKTVVKGDTILYRLTMDATPAREELAYNVHKLGMVDDYDEEYLSVDPALIRVADKATGTDVTGQFNIQVSDGVVYVFAKTVDTVSPSGDPIPGDPQPADLKAYDAAAINPATDPIINQDLMGAQYWVTIPTTVTKETDGYVIENQARQNLQNTHKQTRIVSNPLKDIDPKKDVVISPETGDQSINGAKVALNSTFNYRLDSSEIPANRAYDATQWSKRDTFDRIHDSYTGVWAVHANTDLYDGQKKVAKKGDLLADSSGFTIDGNEALFSAAFDEASYTFTVTATQAYLDLVNTRGDLPQAFSVYTKMVRIAPAERVENVETETYNGEDRDTNVVWTSTPENPAIDVEKFTLSEGLTTGDRDKADQAYSIPKKELTAGTPVGIRVTNTGDVPLRNVTLTDNTHQGLAGTVTDISCTVGATTVPGNKIGNLAVGEQVECRGVLTGVKDGQLHGDTATVTGESIYTGKKVTDEDPWFATAPGALAATGGELAGGVLLAGGIAAFLGALLATLPVLNGRRRRRAAELADVTPGE